MKNILATTALALMMSTAAYADGHIKPLTTYNQTMNGDIAASTFIGMRVYATETEDYDAWNADTMLPAGSETEWDDIGEVNDVILGRDGMVKAVVLGVGGFIGIGERDVAVAMSDIKMVNEKDDAGDFFLVIKSNKAMLEQAAPFERVTMSEKMEEKAENAATAVKTTAAAATTTIVNATDTAAAKVEETAEAATTEVKQAEAKMDDAGRIMLVRPDMVREGYTVAKVEELTTEMLTGARVYGSKDEDIGEVDKLLMNGSNQIDRLVLDIGGFLGLGEHEVAVTMDEVQIVRGEDGSDVRVYINATQEQLEAQPKYEG